MTKIDNAEMRLRHMELSLEPLRAQLANHPLYQNLQSLEDIKIFMQHHVFAVWDFMSLLKALQRKLTCVEVPWLPAASPSTARFINEIVLEEETDMNEEGQPMSHFEMYLQAMDQLGADTAPISQFLQAVDEGKAIEHALAEDSMDAGVAEFVRYTFSVIETGRPHLIASAFTFGREDVIPEMFMAILQQADPNNALYPKLAYYLKRHIELDGDDHGPLSLKMIAELCGSDDQKWADALAVAKQALKHRIALWHSIRTSITLEQPSTLLSLS
ncbi:MAG: DUF3050 domain-containing protein [Bacteroidota bacterium]